MVYHNHKLVFIAVPKCMTTSIHRELRTQEEIDNRHGHRHYTFFDLTEEYSNKMLSEYTSFTIVRNPYDRIWSAWKHNFLRQQTIEEPNMIERFQDYIKTDLLLQFKNDDYDRIHFVPQVDFLYLMRRHKLVDHIFKYETFANDWLLFRENHNKKLPEKFVRVNYTAKTDQDPYDNESREIIKKIYEDDFRLFNYL